VDFFRRFTAGETSVQILRVALATFAWLAFSQVTPALKRRAKFIPTLRVEIEAGAADFGHMNNG
jgi:hypothetical protein